VVGIHFQFPKLEALGGNALVAALPEGDFINQPVSPGCLRDIPDAIRIKNVAHHAVAIPIFGSGELGQVGFCQCFRIGHCSPFLVWFWVADATLALAESGVCKRQAASRGTGCTERKAKRSGGSWAEDA
jgi:hypothetical protein